MNNIIGPKEFDKWIEFYLENDPTFRMSYQVANINNWSELDKWKFISIMMADSKTKINTELFKYENQRPIPISL